MPDCSAAEAISLPLAAVFFASDFHRIMRAVHYYACLQSSCLGVWHVPYVRSGTKSSCCFVVIKKKMELDGPKFMYCIPNI